MAERYPLVEQREYGSPGKRGTWLTRRVTRDDQDLPLVAPHQVRVFRVGEEYVEDHGQLRAGDRTVVEASSVTVVDQRVEVPVVVETRIPSAEADDFTVRATFYCTVTDPCAVVRDGITDVEALLLGHLRDVPGLTEDGSDQPIMRSAAVRDRIDARLTAYHEMRPATLSGLRARHGLVEVLTPREVAEALAQEDDDRRRRELDRAREEREQEAALRRALLETELELKREELRNTSALRKERYRQEEELEKEFGRQKYESVRSRFQRGADATQQEHDLTLQAQRNRAQRAELAEDFRLIGADPIAADFNAWRNGDISAAQLAERLHAAEERRDELTDSRLRVAREEELKRVAMEREEHHWEVERDDRRHELTRAEELEQAKAAREEEARRWDLEHEDLLRRRQEQRADAERLHRDARDWAKEQLAVRAQLGKQAIDRGLFDSTMYDAGAFINSVGDVSYPQGAATGGGERDGTRLGASTARPAADGKAPLAGDGKARLAGDAKGRLAGEARAELNGGLRRPGPAPAPAPAPGSAAAPGPAAGASGDDEDDDDYSDGNAEASLEH
ncbi:hypothetical protein ACFWII_01635 [Streptomyces sp. NPDC127063]|uniref:hypothetical protein n=1 Tax=unclassified Streptomyces TaxID=2593676 RepID=UPI003649A3CC